MHDCSASLVLREDHGVGNNHVLSPASNEDNHLSDVIGCQWLAAPVIDYQYECG